MALISGRHSSPSHVISAKFLPNLRTFSTDDATLCIAKSTLFAERDGGVVNASGNRRILMMDPS
ncbi:MAG: hypothetical protein ABN488_06315, partial [Methylobacteriaceae bacterium]